MAKFRTAIAIAAAALLCLFTVSLARAPPRIATAASTTTAFPLSDADPALRLPTVPINTETDPKFAVVSAVPMTEITFRPVNRRFHVKRPCGGHHFKFYPTNMMRERREPISYGNDMILAASGENSDFRQPIGGKRIPGRWTRMRHHRNHHLRHRGEDSDSDTEEEEDRVLKRVVFKRYDYDRFDREKKLKKLRQRWRMGNERREAEKPKQAGFMKGVRKFLTNYF